LDYLLYKFLLRRHQNMLWMILKLMSLRHRHHYQLLKMTLHLHQPLRRLHLRRQQQKILVMHLQFLLDYLVLEKKVDYFLYLQSFQQLHHQNLLVRQLSQLRVLHHHRHRGI
jgi:hypothetical protein